MFDGFRTVGTTSASIAATLGYRDGRRMTFDEDPAVVRRIVVYVFHVRVPPLTALAVSIPNRNPTGLDSGRKPARAAKSATCFNRRSRAATNTELSGRTADFTPRRRLWFQQAGAQRNARMRSGRIRQSSRRKLSSYSISKRSLCLASS
ncbi:MAG: hypothetical protein JSV78_04435 [Phycisphaerales bacterium]|nr:MAG: hypothetical protein JSV78_04435 [Phycisphaerales bacterium]